MMNRFTKFLLVASLTAMILPMAGSLHADEVQLGGFVEGLWGAGLNDNNPVARDYPAAETRLQLRFESYADRAEAFARVDFVQDGFDSANYDWQIREAYVKFRTPINIDFKIGRQILTWGTGDLIFINDVFAKDYVSFFVGRQDQYLKAPQTALRAEWYTKFGSFSFVGIPAFEPNVLPTGDRLSFYNPMTGAIVGADGYMPPDKPAAKFENGELAFRYAKQVKSFKLAGYAYRGFFKEPRGVRNPGTQYMQLYYPRLNVYGASLRGQVMGGIVWVEGGYFDSREDQRGLNYFIENSSSRAFAGFERQVANDLTGNIQFEVDVMNSYGNYETSYNQMVSMLPAYAPVPHKADEVRTLLTSRWTKQFLMQTLTISLFGFYSPSDEDGYIRFSTEYKYTDELGLVVGGNIFAGNHPYTMFGQFQLDDNVYVRANYGF